MGVKINSRFYVIYGDGVPIYVGYTNRTVKQRFKEHTDSKDFTDYDDVKVVDLVDQKLSYDFTWEYEVTCKNAQEVSDRESNLIAKYNTQESIYQKAIGGGQTWSFEKYFVKTNKDNPKYQGMSSKDLQAYLIKYKSRKDYLRHFISSIEDSRKVYLKNFINRIEDPRKIYLTNFISGIEDPRKIYLTNFISGIQDPRKVYLKHFISSIEDPRKVYLKNFINCIEDHRKTYLTSFIKHIEDHRKTYLTSFISGIQDPRKTYLTSFISGIQDPRKIYLKNFINHTR